MKAQAINPHQATHNAVFAHPISHSLQWLDVLAMLTSMTEVSEEQNGSVKFSRNGHTIVVHPPKHKENPDVDTVMRIRDFLTQSQSHSPAAAEPGQHILVVIDHREARIYGSNIEGSVPQRIVAHDHGGTHRYLHNVDNNANGQRKSDLKAFYEAVAKALTGSQQILIFGSATGTSSAMTHLLSELNAHHSEIARKVIGTVAVDASHMTEPQLLAKAREFYQHNSPKSAAHAGTQIKSDQM